MTPPRQGILAARLPAYGSRWGRAGRCRCPTAPAARGSRYPARPATPPHHRGAAVDARRPAGARAPRTDALSSIATVNAHGLSVSVGYVSGRLVIEISGLDTEDGKPEPGPGLSLVTSHDPPRQYGGLP